MGVIIIDGTINSVYPVGRPKNNATFCKVCGIALPFENCRETKKGSGSLRSKCRSCERKADRLSHKKKAKPKKHKRNKSKIPVFTEELNRARMAVQSVKRKTIEDIIYTYFDDALCEECSGTIRYDEKTLERVCSKCGLIDETPEYAYDLSSSSTENHRAGPVEVGIIKEEEKRLLRKIRRER